MEISQTQVVAERLARNRLVTGTEATRGAEVVAALCGIQAQDLPAARLAIRVRSRGLTDAWVEAERVEDRTLVRTWAMRGTLHLIATEDLEWIRSLTGPASIRSNARRSAELGLDEATYRQALKLTERELSGGAMTRTEWKQALERHGVDTSGQRAPYLLSRASAEGLICEGPLRSGKPTYVLVEEWLPGPAGPALDPETALNRLVHRYLAAYGPATADDLATWSGLGLGECRAAFAEAAPELVVVAAGERRFWSTGEPSTGPSPAGLRLLPSFDTFLLGYRDRSLHIDPEHLRKVNAGGGIVKPVVIVNGRALGTWQLKRRVKSATVEVAPFEPGSGFPAPELEAEVADIGRFLDLEVKPAAV